jgi:ABC-2 type transport system ATP-binding protein
MATALENRPPLVAPPIAATELAIDVRELRRSYRKRKGWFRSAETVDAVKGISFSVPRGTIFGMLGPNGSGKTTTIKMLSTLLLPSSGSASINGYDVVRDEMSVRRELGVLFGGDRGLYNQLSARENLRYFGRLYGLSGKRLDMRIDEMLERVELTERAEERVEAYSRGMKQRVHIAKTLLHEPEVVILDEPSIGLDPGAQIELRDLIAGLVPRYSVLLATHDMHEADVLCRELAIMDRGDIVAMDSPSALKASIRDRAVVLTLATSIEASDRQPLILQLWDLPTVSRVIPTVSDAGHTVLTIRCEEASPVLERAIPMLGERGIALRSIDFQDPTLEAVFLRATGRTFEEDTEEGAAA